MSIIKHGGISVEIPERLSNALLEETFRETFGRILKEFLKNLMKKSLSKSKKMVGKIFERMRGRFMDITTKSSMKRGNSGRSLLQILK